MLPFLFCAVPFQSFVYFSPAIGEKQNDKYLYMRSHLAAIAGLVFQTLGLDVLRRAISLIGTNSCFPESKQSIHRGVEF